MAEEDDRDGAEAITAPTPQALLTCAYEVLAMLARDCVLKLKDAAAEAKGDPLLVLGRTIRAVGGLARSVRLVVELSLRPPKARKSGDEMDDDSDGSAGRDDADEIERLRAQLERDFLTLRRVYEHKRADAGLEREGASPSYGRQSSGSS